MYRVLSASNQEDPISNISSIDLILFVNDVDQNLNIPVYASDSFDDYFRDWNDYDFIDAYQSGDISTLRRIQDFDVLDKMMDLKNENSDFSYEFTQKQKDILSKGYKNAEWDNETQREKLKVPYLLDLIKKCNNCTIPFPRTEKDLEKNFAQIHNLRLAPEDYLAIVKQFTSNDFYGFVKSHYADYLGNKIYRFIREDDFKNSVAEDIGHYTLWMEINVKQTYDKHIVALISLHDAESQNRY